jgi:hypothetical protein
MGLRLHIRRLQAQTGDVVLLFQDEADVLNVPYLTRVWAKKGIDLRVEAPGKMKKRCLCGVRDSRDGRLLVHVSQSKRTSDFLSLLSLIDNEYAPLPGRVCPPVVMVLDNGPSHTSHATKKALLARSDWLFVEWLPKFSPELNDIERDWKVLKSRYLGNRNYAHEIDLEKSIIQAIEWLNAERRRNRATV